MKNARQLRWVPRLDESLLGAVTLDILGSLGKVCPIESTLEKFLARYPHYGVSRARFKSECELACAACAIIALYIGRPTVRQAVAIEDFNSFLKGRGYGEKMKTRTLRVLEPNHFARIRSHIETFFYVYTNSRHISDKSCAAVSGLSTMAFSAAAHATRRNHLNGMMHQETNNAIHELLMPLLVSTFQTFGGSGRQTKACS